MRSRVTYAKVCVLALPFEPYMKERKRTSPAKNKSRMSAVGEHYGMHHPTSEPRLQFRITYRTEKNELRLRIEEAMAIRDASLSMNRQKEETGIDFLTRYPNTFPTNITAIFAPHSHQTFHQALSKEYLSRDLIKIQYPH